MFATLATCDDVRRQMIAIEAKYFPASKYYDRLWFAIQSAEAVHLGEWLHQAFEVEPRERMREWIVNTKESDLEMIWDCCVSDPELMEGDCGDAFILLLESWSVDRPMSFDSRFIPVLDLMQSPLRLYQQYIIDAAAEFARRPEIVAALQRLAFRLADADRDYVQQALKTQVC